MTVTLTPRLGLPISSSSADPRQNTRAKFNELMGKLEDKVAIDAQGTYAARPSTAPRGTYYHATDVNTVYRSTGTGWVGVGTDAARLTGVAPVGVIPNLSAGKITSGVLGVDRIPGLDVAKITSGVFNAARIPNLSANKITSEVLGVPRIPDLPASKITSGQLHTDRLPTTLYSKTLDGASTVAGGLRFGSQDNYVEGVGGQLSLQGNTSVRIFTLNGGGGNSVTLGATTLVAPPVYDNTYSQSANVYVTQFGTLGRSTSARRYKTNIQDAQIDPQALFRLRPRTWWDKAQIERGKEGDYDDESKRPVHIGLVAEEVLEAGLGQLVTHTPEGEVDGLQYDRFIAPVIVTMKWLRDQVDALTQRVAEIEAAQ